MASCQQGKSLPWLLNENMYLAEKVVWQAELKGVTKSPALGVQVLGLVNDEQSLLQLCILFGTVDFNKMIILGDVAS